MRLAVHTYPYRDRSLADALDEIARLRTCYVEVWLGHAPDGPDRAARSLGRRGFEAAAVSAGGIYATGSDVPARAFELAGALHAPIVVACIAPSLLDDVAERVPAGIALCVENHWDQPLARSRDLTKALADRPSLAACVDTGHAILAGEPPERFVASLGGRVRHVHLKDAAFPPLHGRLMGRRARARLLPRPIQVYPGTGALDVGRVRRALDALGFEGTVTVEYEGHDPSAALERLRAEWASSVEAPGARV